MISILMSREMDLIQLTSQATSTHRQRTHKDLSKAIISRVSTSNASQVVSIATSKVATVATI